MSSTKPLKMDKARMKRSNRQLVFTEIHCQGAVSRSQLASLTGLSSMSTGRIADELIRSGLVVEEEIDETVSAVGRRPRMLSVAADHLFSLGLELDRDRMAAGILDFNGKIVLKRERRSDFSRLAPEDTITQAAELLAELTGILNADLPQPRVFTTCGVACPGIIDSTTGMIHLSSQLAWQEVPLAELLAQKSGLSTIVVDNELKARGQAELLFGPDKHCKRLAVLNFGTGVGSALIINRKVYRGRNNMAGELGHVCIDPNGSLCECGKRGCLQTYLSDAAILRDAQQIVPRITLDGFFDAYSHKDKWAASIMDYMVKYASIAVGMVANLYAPDVIVLCGSLIEHYPVLCEAILRDSSMQLNRFSQGRLMLKASGLGADGNLAGAGTLAFYQELDMFT